MSNKYKKISKLYDETIQTITNDSDCWKEFLETSGRIYKYPFNEQVLIYAQRPDAVACASMNIWNNNMRCWVKRGSKGIALLDTDNAKTNKLKYVFDVQDVYQNNKLSKLPYHWVYHEHHAESIIDRFSDTFSLEYQGSSMVEAVISLSEMLVDESLEDVIEELSTLEDNNKLSDLTEGELEETVKKELSSTIAYTILNRCGIDLSEYADYFGFDNISLFNTNESLLVFGEYASQTSEDVLLTITNVIRNYNKERNISENALENVENINYNEFNTLKRKSESGSVIVQNERSDIHEDRIQSERGISDSELGSRSGAGGNIDEVGTNEKNLHDGESQGDIFGVDVQRHSENEIIGDTRESGEDVRRVGEQDNERGERDGTAQSRESGRVGSESEQHQSESGGNNQDRIDIHSSLEDSSKPVQLSLFPSFDEQSGNVFMAVANDSNVSATAFSLENDSELYKQIIRHYPVFSGYEYENKKYTFYELAIMGMDAESLAERLKNEYAGHKIGFLNENEEKMSLVYDSLSLSVAKGTSVYKAKTEDEIDITYQEMAESIIELVRQGEYLTSEDISIAKDKYLGDFCQKISYIIGDLSDDFEKPELFVEKPGHYPAATDFMKDIVTDSEKRKELISFFERDDLSFRFNANKERTISNILEELRLIDKDRLLETSPVNDDNITEIGSFYITEDTIDSLIIPKSSSARAKIYDAYLNDDKKTIVEVLKNHYGDSGSSGRSLHTSFSRGKGFEVNQGFTLEPFDKVKFSWSAIAKRIVDIIEEAPEDFIEKYELEEYYRNQKLDKITSENQEIINKIGSLEDELSSLIDKNFRSTQLAYEKYDGQGVYKATSEIFNSVGREKEHYESVLSILEENIKSLEKLDNAWYEFNEAKINVFRDSENNWQYNLYDKDGKEIDGGSCTDQELRIDKAAMECIALSLPEENIPKNILPINEPEFEEKQIEHYSTEKIENLQSNNGLTPEEEVIVNSVEANNYVITNNEIGLGTQKEKYQNNVAAIKLMKELELNERNATPEEQEILSKYVGWGGLADAFDSDKTFWQKEYKELQEVLTPEEYTSARSSTLNAHYTSPTIIKAMYSTLNKMGFSNGNILEPSMGIGHFFGCLPDTMNKSSLYGVELDDISGRIAKKLYPKSNIQITGFEKTKFPNDFFDVAIGNVPFGDYKVNDTELKNANFNIHDYFFAKSLDKLRSGGIIAFITTKGTMDKKATNVREYIAERADLIGAIRLPNNAFKANAGTEVTSDIIFLKKRETPSIHKPSWVNTSQVGDMTLNNYFIEHPEMVLGKMEMISGRFGMESACLPEGDFQEKLSNAIEKIAENGFYEEVELTDMSIDEEFEDMTIPAVPNVTNYSHCIVDNKIYYRENSIMKLVDLTDNQRDRVADMIELRDTAYEVLNYQLEDFSDEEINDKQNKLNALYDEFIAKYGYISSAPNQKTNTNEKLFKDDYGLPLLMSLENFDEEGNYVGKSAIFTERTVKKKDIPDKVDNSTEALALSLNEKGKVDMNYMMELTEKNSTEIEKDLEGVIFVNPLTKEYESSDEYLSGNVREKLEIAKEEQALHDVEGDSERGRYDSNVKSLENVQPTPLEASEIEIRLGSTWIEPDIIKDFMMEVLKTPSSYLGYYEYMSVEYSKHTDTWYIKGKNQNNGNPLVTNTYGTSRANAYKILEETLNLKDIRIYDTVEDSVTGKEKRVLNQRETAIAQQKQDMLKEQFSEWIFKDIDRRNMLVERYNTLFNSIRPREYDGSFLNFSGMSLDISLKDYQKNAVARMLYGGNTLLAHCVGAGKTFEMVTGAMESKRLGLCNKSLFVVPNHLTEQWGADFLRLYPNAKVLVATKKDFTPLNRKRFASKIATGDYDAVIIGHTQFEKIPLSLERQARTIQKQIDEIIQALEEVPLWDKKSFSVKQLEKTKKNLETKLAKLSESKKDDVVTFEQLGVDRLFVDESHYYKNLFMYTKMRNVSGVTSTEAKKSSDMYAKCMYIDEITGGKGITFATGTPISNTLSEMYTNMKYLQNGTLNQMGLSTFDAWASAFAEPKTEMELAPEGTGYRLKTRLARFYNLPELVNVFKECADIQTADMLKLPVPEAEFEDVVLEPSEFQKKMIESFAERAEKVRTNQVDPSTDNMLKITNDGRFLALDERMINPDAIDDGNNKATACADRAFEIWEDTKEQRSTQLIFSDISTPKGDGSFSIYEDIRDKLIKKGVPAEEIAFIHDANTEKRKSDLFAKVRSGQVRFLFGSTQKLGAGTNVQDKLIALHHLDVPWRPADIEQQEGRIIRRGNENEKVKIFRYIKKGTFDSYSWQLIEKKQRFISQIMTSKLPVRAADDIDEATLSYAEVKALATDNPLIKEKMELDNKLQKLKLARSNYQNQKYKLENEIALTYPKKIKTLEEHIKGLENDSAIASKYASDDNFNITVGDKLYTDKKEGAEALKKAIKENGNFSDFKSIGYYKDFEILARFEAFSKQKVLNLKGSASHYFNASSSDDPFANIVRIDNAIAKLPKDLEDAKGRYEVTLKEFEEAKKEVQKPFRQEQEYLSITNRLKQLELDLDLDAQELDKKEEEVNMTDEEMIEKIQDNIEDCKTTIDNITEKSDEYSKELVSDVEKGVIVEEDIPENDNRFSMYNEKDVVENSNKFAIYQLKDSSENLLFRGYDDIISDGFDVDRANYNLVYIGDYNPDMSLNSIYEKFNINRPFDFKGHSLSVSDIIVINDGVNINSSYVDSIGFKNINDFIKIESEPSMSTEAEIDSKFIEETSILSAEISEEQRAERLISVDDAEYQKAQLSENYLEKSSDSPEVSSGGPKH